MQFVLEFCAISPIRKDKQLLRKSLTCNNFNTFLFVINMFKLQKKNTPNVIKIKTPERYQIRYLCS